MGITRQVSCLTSLQSNKTTIMTFPSVHYKYNNLEAGEKLANLMDQKLAPLGKLLPEDAPVSCEVEFEKVSPHQHGRVHRVEANLTVNGVLHRTEAVEETFEQAIDEVRDELNKKLRRSKDKSVSMLRKAGQRVKEKFFTGR